MDAKQTLGEPRLLISRRALLHNASLIRQHLSPAVRLCAMIKADAYGHGALIAADTLCNFTNDASGRPPADAFAVASIDEATELPPLGVPVLILRPLENAFIGRQRLRIEEAIRQGWVMTICSATGAEDVARIALTVGKRANVQVMVETGMCRGGVTPAEISEILQRIESRPSLKLWGLCTHFASAENPESPFTLEQSDKFSRATDGVAAAAAGRLIRHAANSGALFFHPATHFDMVRPGLALYGIDPTGRPSVQRALRPALKWTAPIVNITEVPAGSTVGYGRTWAARRPSRIGLLPIGYADGYPRSFSNGASVMLHGRSAPVIGRISMDMTTIDLTDHPDAHPGEDVTLLDDNPLSPVSVYELARWANTIPYEILSRIGPRVKRVAVDPEDAPFEESEAEASEQDWS
jgi:alanine racemase